VATETTPKGEETTYKRDAHGKVEVIERPAPGATTQKWSFAHAANGDLESETDPLGHETRSAYDKDGNLETLTDANGHTTKYTYDADNEQTKTEAANGTIIEAAYDSEGQVVSRTNGNAKRRNSNATRSSS
jgi:YD repeat-containing protein